MQIVLPCANGKLRAAATQRPNQICKKFDYLTLDVEKDMTELILSEVRLHRESEELKQELESSKGFDKQSCYNAIDDCSMNYIY